jgi:hypothetical protein
MSASSRRAAKISAPTSASETAHSSAENGRTSTSKATGNDQEVLVFGDRESNEGVSEVEGEDEEEERKDEILERKLVRKIDLRLCTIAGILCSLNLLDSGVISSASVTSIFTDLGLGEGNRYVSCLFLFCSSLNKCGCLEE